MTNLEEFYDTHTLLQRWHDEGGNGPSKWKHTLTEKIVWMYGPTLLELISVSGNTLGFTYEYNDDQWTFGITFDGDQFTETSRVRSVIPS